MKIWITLNEPWVVAVTSHHLLLCHHHRLTIAIFFIVAATTFLTIITIFFPITIILIILSQVLGHGTGEHAPGDVGIGTLVYQVPPFRYRTNSTT